MTTHVLIDTDREIVGGFVIVIPVAAFTQAGEGGHADGGKFRSGTVRDARPSRAKAQGGNVKALRTVVVEIGEAIEAVADSDDSGGIDGEQVVQLRGVNTAQQTPTTLCGGRVEPRVAGFERIVAEVAQAGTPPTGEIFVDLAGVLDSARFDGGGEREIGRAKAGGGRSWSWVIASGGQANRV